MSKKYLSFVSDKKLLCYHFSPISKVKPFF